MISNPAPESSTGQAYLTLYRDHDIIGLRYKYVTSIHGQPNIQAMAELRYQIRLFLRFSENAARQAGIEPQQHQLLLAIKGLPHRSKPTIGVLAERMQLQPHSTVGLIDRLVERGFLVRLRATDDRRQVLVKLTHDGEELLEKLALHHLRELQSVGPKFRNVLQSLMEVSYGASDQETVPNRVKTKSRREDRVMATQNASAQELLLDVKVAEASRLYKFYLNQEKKILGGLAIGVFLIIWELVGNVFQWVNPMFMSAPSLIYQGRSSVICRLAKSTTICM